MEDMMTIKSTAGIADNIAALQTASRSYFREAVFLDLFWDSIFNPQG